MPSFIRSLAHSLAPELMGKRSSCRGCYRCECTERGHRAHFLQNRRRHSLLFRWILTRRSSFSSISFPPFLPSAAPLNGAFNVHPSMHVLCLPSKQAISWKFDKFILLITMRYDTIWYNDLKMLLGQGEIANCDTTDFKNDLIERPLSWHWGRLRANSRLANIFSESTWIGGSFAVWRKIMGCQLLSQIALESFVLDFCWF